jgi:hypothetical protein
MGLVKMKNEIKELKLKQNLTTKFAVLFFILFIFFWDIYFQKVSKYFILMVMWLFLGITLYYFVLLFFINRELKELK